MKYCSLWYIGHWDWNNKFYKKIFLLLETLWNGSDLNAMISGISFKIYFSKSEEKVIYEAIMTKILISFCLGDRYVQVDLVFYLI
jgi:hypothetical protein